MLEYLGTAALGYVIIRGIEAGVTKWFIYRRARKKDKM